MIFESTRFFNFHLTTRNSLTKCGHAHGRDQKLTITLLTRQVIILFASVVKDCKEILVKELRVKFQIHYGDLFIFKYYSYFKI